jgi:hypothetical protein
MAFDWPNLAMGAVLGFFVHWGFVGVKERWGWWKLRKAYANLARIYVNFLVKDGGAEERTGGTITLTQLSDGSFEVKGVNADGTLDWSSKVRMSLEPKGTGTGWYRYPSPATTDYGEQQLRYIPETRSLHVVTTTTSDGNSRSFVHHWRPKEGDILLSGAHPAVRAEPTHFTAIGEGDIRAEDRIQIIVPRPGDVLTEPAPFGKGFSYMVRGRLKSLPQGHAIWLLTQDERSGEVWPHGFDPVQFNEQTGEWHGRINAGALASLRIFAVVAPPTSQMLFRYFQERGDATKTYAALKGVPPECHNRHSVQAKLP